ncbi:hypothetical protein [Clostridium algidicarnis]|uniref:Uncharacterized protein n=1 Tax=Clostridium algidicarnis DSM 15099 TaxID=1121295 RepID=A0A2S6FU93_9CLOT|nr:hypothetical protein [Clostridium algidicarnis]PPK43239.1 hypothetical protein BD821_1315 [Clostridium algidicarnis DSM 15099]
MYKKHKCTTTITFVSVFILTFFLNINFEDVASDCISIVSFALAVYAICISALIGSPLLESLRSNIDAQISDRTQLGVIKNYIRIAIFISVITLVLACISKIKINSNIIMLILNKLNYLNPQQLFSSLCFAFFSLNFLFIIFIFMFIINRQVD